MGVMATAVMNYVFSPLSGLWSGINTTCEIIGYSRDASELARLGYHEEAKSCMMEIKKLKS